MALPIRSRDTLMWAKTMIVVEVKGPLAMYLGAMCSRRLQEFEYIVPKVERCSTFVSRFCIKNFTKSPATVADFNLPIRRINISINANMMLMDAKMRMVPPTMILLEERYRRVSRVKIEWHLIIVI